MRHGLAAAPLHRQTRLRAVQCLNLALFVHTKHQRVFRGIEIKADNRLQLLSEVWIVADFEALDAMRLQSVGAPDAADAGLGNAHRTRHAATRPVGGSGRLGLRRTSNHLADDVRRNLRCSSRPGSILQQTLDPLLNKSASPKGHHARRNPHPLRNLIILHSFGGQQNNAASLCHAHRSRPPARQLLQFQPGCRAYLESSALHA